MNNIWEHTCFFYKFRFLLTIEMVIPDGDLVPGSAEEDLMLGTYFGTLSLSVRGARWCRATWRFSKAVEQTLCIWKTSRKWNIQFFSSWILIDFLKLAIGCNWLVLTKVLELGKICGVWIVPGKTVIAVRAYSSCQKLFLWVAR